MSGSHPVPSEHPNNDLLADLAAEVLPDDLAGSVRDHVRGCAVCAGLLADAEGVRQMLLQVEPEEMPDDILLRIEQAMATARREDEIAPAAEGGETRLLNRVPPGAETGRADPGRRIARAGGPATGRLPIAGPMTGSLATGPKTGRLSRMSAPAQSARRQAIEEQKADRPSRFAKFAPALRIAAGVLVVAGVGAAVVQFTGIPGQGGDSAASSADAGTPVLVAPVLSTDSNYTRQAMSKQVKALIDGSQQALAQGAASGSAEVREFSATDDATAAPKAGASSAAEPSVDPSARGQLLRSPKALQACLAAIEADQVQPIAVDLARYGNREAAIIVLPATGGGYDVWVVARDCRADSDGAIAVINNVQP